MPIERLERFSVGRAAIMAGLLAVGPWSACLPTDAAASQAPNSVISLEDRLDVAATSGGGFSRVEPLNALDLALDVDLSRLVQIRNVALHLDGLATSGATPGARIALLQGVDNLETTSHRARLYQAWTEWSAPQGKGTVRLGISDLTGEFAVADDASDFVTPAFGTLPEYAATGPLGAPSFPSPSLVVRARYNPTDATYIQAAAVDAKAGSPGDIQGLDVRFGRGALLIAEAGWTGRGKMAVGGWTYTASRMALNGSKHSEHGVYALFDTSLKSVNPGLARVSAFVRGGWAGPEAAVFTGSAQAGVTLKPVLTRRPQSVLAFGYSFGQLSAEQARASADGHDSSGRDEQLVEALYSDQVSPNLRAQPYVQHVVSARAGAARGTTIVGVRLDVGLTSLQSGRS